MANSKTILAALLLFPVMAMANDPYVPPVLEEWTDWVLHGQEWRTCPMRYDASSASAEGRICSWPGTLALEVTERGLSFSQTWTVYGKPRLVPLPGSVRHWPGSVSVDGRPALVLSRNNVPAIELAPGEHRVSGRMRWEERPGVIQVPAQLGLIELRVDGRRIESPEVDRDRLFLGQRASAAAVTQDALDTKVYRLLVDELPGELVTRLRIDVSGSVREVLFGPLLPESYAPVSLGGQLPARFEPDGRLRVQLRPGRWQLELKARAPGSVDALTVPSGGSNLPDSEILSYLAVDRLRVTAPEGLVPVDPTRVDVPNEWQSFPAFRLTEGDELTIVERSRGIVDVANTLSLNRRMWADFDGRGLTVRDRITGEMLEDWRLDMQTPYELQSAEVDGQQILVTEGADDGQRGVEIRQPAVRLETLARTEDRGAIPVSGWDTRFTSIQTELNLPPGQRLLAAPGADSANGSWLREWQLLDIFLLLIITASAWKLLGRSAGIVAFAGLALSYHEAGAPSWLWLNLLATAALLRVAPAGKLSAALKGYFFLGLLSLVIALLPFAADQLRAGLYPQLDRGLYSAPGSQSGSSVLGSDMATVPPAAEPAALERQAVRRAGEAADLVEELVVDAPALALAASVSSQKRFARFEANALVQAGPGVPEWRWNSYRLAWSGPVEAGQTHRLIVVPTWLLSVWRFAAVLLLAAFAAFLFAEAFNRRLRLPGGSGFAAASGVVLIMLAGGGALAPAPAGAEIPDPALLGELERRLTEPHPCEPRCADIVSARITVEPAALAIELGIHASVDVVVPVPGLSKDWTPSRVALDGELVDGAVRDGGVLLVPVPAGQHRLLLFGSLPERASVEVAFPENPRTVEITASGWSYSGLSEGRLIAGSLTLEREREESEPQRETVWESTQFPQFVRISRRLDFGIEWGVTTTVQRVAPATGAIEIDVPLLDGESVLAESLEVRDDIATVTMPPGQSLVRWESTLPSTSPLELTAPDGSEAEEVWYVAAGSVWHLDFDGVPENLGDARASDARVAEFNPRPGETLRISARRPAASPGATIALDSLRMNTSVGRRLAETGVSFHYRATRGDQHVIQLPEGAELTAVIVDNRREPLRAVNGALTLPILPGTHQVRLEFSEPRAAGFVTRSPALDLGLPASNVSLTLAPERNRWLLFASGPALGPAVLYWSELVVLFGLALLLGRVSWTPLRTPHWLLLALGFSTFNWPVLGLVVAWLLATGARERWPLELKGLRFNALQVGFALLTLAALGAILVSLPAGLLGQPDMHVVGNGSRAGLLNWFADRSPGALPTASFVSLPMWTYKALILVWALWLSFALLRWLPWVWKVFARDGLWQSMKRRGAGVPRRE
ncbi:MAG: hypothetical protein AAFX56_14805 [Pseudomonadota bacterium]